MKMITKPNGCKVIQFENDTEFTDFVFGLENTITDREFDGIPRSFFEYEYSPSYLQAVKEDKYFEILDPNTQMPKRRRVQKGMAFLPVKNI